MNYIDVLIPFIGGLVCLLAPASLIKATDPRFDKKKKLVKICGFILLGVALLYFIAKQFV